MTEPVTYPVLPMRDAVLFPGVKAPVAAGRPGTVRAVEAALAQHGGRILVLAQRRDEEEATPELLYTIGTLAQVEHVQRGLAGLQLVLQGESRGIVLRIAERDGYLEATAREAEEMAPLDAASPAFVALFREARERAGELARKAGLPAPAVEQFLAEVEDPGKFADLVAAFVDLPTPERQALLETLAVEERLQRVLVHMQRQIAVLDAQEEIKSKVKEQLGDRQREMILRQQLRAIEEELGEGVQRRDLDELREKLAALDLPETARKEVDRELGRLARMGAEAMESQVIRTFLETIAELPWNERSAEDLDLGRAAEILDRDHYALQEVKDRVLEFLAVRTLRAGTAAAAASRAEVDSATTKTGGRGQIMLFVGPPGVGKTSVARSIARAMGREYVRISLGGVRDEADIRGHRRTYVGAMPGRIIQGMKQAGTRNPVFLLDEVDKLGVSYQGDPAAALLEVLDPAQNDTFTDHYLGVPFDLSEVLFIATANFLQSIPPALLDRMDLVTFDGYTAGEKLEIARRYLVPRQLAEGGLDAGRVELADEAIQEITAGYTREAGVRQLEREIGRVVRKAARRIASGEVERMAVGAREVRELLGRPTMHAEQAADVDQVGVATGMFYTPVGGDIMFVEVATMKGKGDLTLTGQLGDVMRESARAAWSYARAHAEALHISTEAFERDVHVHVPAGAIPKDGPSAGVTMATALVSALSGRPAAHDLAMTGEITLSGRVLPIGGVKEKVLGAARAGITRVVLPAENVADLEELPEDVRERLEVHGVRELGEVFALALRGSEYREGRLLFGGEDPEGVVPLSSLASH
jgi:ATP-dependent Lon protease